MQLRTELRTRSRRRLAFTLMEVLVVVAILVILAGVGAGVTLRYLETAKEGAAKAGVTKLETAVMTYHTKNETFPESLAALAQPGDGGYAYIEVKELKDPWGQPYQYDANQHSPTGKPLIYSNGKPGTGKMIRNWD